MTTDTLAVATETPEPDCAWPPSKLDLEPEVCFCLAHGQELPCVVCELPHRLASAKGQP
jgi:hypothetical protein